MPHLQANAENKTGRTPLPKTEGMEERKGRLKGLMEASTFGDGVKRGYNRFSPLSCTSLSPSKQESFLEKILNTYNSIPNPVNKKGKKLT